MAFGFFYWQTCSIKLFNIDKYEKDYNFNIGDIDFGYVSIDKISLYYNLSLKKLSNKSKFADNLPPAPKGEL